MSRLILASLLASLLLSTLVLSNAGSFAQTNDEIIRSRPAGTDRSLYPPANNGQNTTNGNGTGGTNTTSGTGTTPNTATNQTNSGSNSPNSGGVANPTNPATGNAKNANAVSLYNGPHVKPPPITQPNPPIRNRMPIKPRP